MAFYEGFSEAWLALPEHAQSQQSINFKQFKARYVQHAQAAGGIAAASCAVMRSLFKRMMDDPRFSWAGIDADDARFAQKMFDDIRADEYGRVIRGQLADSGWLLPEGHAVFEPLSKALTTQLCELDAARKAELKAKGVPLVASIARWRGDEKSKAMSKTLKKYPQPAGFWAAVLSHPVQGASADAYGLDDHMRRALRNFVLLQHAGLQGALTWVDQWSADAIGRLADARQGQLLKQSILARAAIIEAQLLAQHKQAKATPQVMGRDQSHLDQDDIEAHSELEEPRDAQALVSMLSDVGLGDQAGRRFDAPESNNQQEVAISVRRVVKAVSQDAREAFSEGADSQAIAAALSAQGLQDCVKADGTVRTLPALRALQPMLAVADDTAALDTLETDLLRLAYKQAQAGDVMHVPVTAWRSQAAAPGNSTYSQRILHAARDAAKVLLSFTNNTAPSLASGADACPDDLASSAEAWPDDAPSAARVTKAQGAPTDLVKDAAVKAAEEAKKWDKPSGGYTS